VQPAIAEARSHAARATGTWRPPTGEGAAEAFDESQVLAFRRALEQLARREDIVDQRAVQTLLLPHDGGQQRLDPDPVGLRRDQLAAHVMARLVDPQPARVHRLRERALQGQETLALLACKLEAIGEARTLAAWRPLGATCAIRAIEAV
jgi:hypothetical protein